MLKNLVGGSPSSERAGKSPRAAARKLRAVVESLKGRTMMSVALMSVALMSVAVSGVADRSIPIPAETTTVKSSRVTSNLASADAATTTTINLDFDTPLVAEIEKLKNAAGYDATKKPPYKEGLVPEGRKALLLDLALGHYEALFGKPSSFMKAYGLNATDLKMYEISPSPKEPGYFTDLFKNNLTNVTNTHIEYYDYKGGPSTFWVDFANHKLGGGVFGNGFVQEETMFLETPELANAAAQKPPLFTRTGGAGPLEGSPTPLIFVGANRVMNIDQTVLNGVVPPGQKLEKWEMASVTDLKTYDVPLKPAQNINVLAMAAPDVSGTKGDKAAPDIVKDLFNTFVAGFTLAKNAGVGKTILINTGPIGAGAFKNNKVVVNVMQQLAAMQVGGVDLKFWSYTDTAMSEANHVVSTIIGTFTTDKTNKSISHLLVIAEYEMRNIRD